MKTEDLKNQIWTTRISRVNAEKRLINKEKFFQGINIYYSCLTIIYSILSLVNHDDKLSLMTVFMTISLLIAILYLNSQKYLDNAREYRKNYTQLQRLEFQLDNVNNEDNEKIADIEEKYCDLLDSTSNHISYDYYCTVYSSRGDYRSQRWDKKTGKLFYFNNIWRFLLKLVIILFPIVLYLLCEVI